MAPLARPPTISSSGSWWSSLGRPWAVVVLAGFVRVALVCWAEYQDAFLPVKYTDIDYIVFTDAARFVSAGGSPYQRSTYRYSPLLAYLLLPNIWLHAAWGKVLFSAADLAAAGLISYLLSRTSTLSPRLHAAALAVWLFNPYTVTISTRGSCDVLNVLLLLGLLACLLHGRVIASGMLYGLAVHFRVYPVIYGPAVALFLVRRRWILLEREGGQLSQPYEWDAGSMSQYEGQPPHLFAKSRTSAATATTPAVNATAALEGRVRAPVHRRTASWRRVISALRPSAAFSIAAASTFLLLGAAFYRLYGSEFLHEAFVHHLTRKDPRHNFSPYYYPIYLSYGVRSSGVGAQCATQASIGASLPPPLMGAWSAVRLCLPVEEPWRVAMLPQAAVLLAVAFRYHEDLPAAWMLQTWSFVALNKVITAQYYVWFLSLLPLTLPVLVAQRAVSSWALGAALLVWVAAQLHWLGWAYALEMRGLSVHVGVWAAALGFLAANTAAVALLLRALRPGLHGAATFMDASLAMRQPRPADAIALAAKKHM